MLYKHFIGNLTSSMYPHFSHAKKLGSPSQQWKITRILNIKSRSRVLLNYIQIFSHVQI